MRRVSSSSFVLTTTVTALLALSCMAPLGDPDRELPDPDPAHPWVRCNDIESAAPNSKVINAGTADTLLLPRGHLLEVPAGALQVGDPPVTVHFNQKAGPHAAVVAWSVPADQVFNERLTLTLSIEGRTCDVNDAEDLRIHRALDDGPPHEELPGAAVPPTAAWGTLDRFSTFAIAQ